MIAAPLNDRACLDAITAIAVDLVAAQDPMIGALAVRFPSREALIEWLRSLPQRDDDGAPDDGPKVDTCRPPQRLRIAPPDPNCVERTLVYVAVREWIDARAVLQLATTDTEAGLHTFPVEDGEPVVLDPAVSRNALRGGLFRNAPAPVRMTPAEAIDWIADLAVEPAAPHRGGRERVECARVAMHALLIDGIALEEHEIEEVAWVLAVAEREARAFGPCGVVVVLTAAEVLAAENARAPIARNRRGVRVGRFRVRPHPALAGVARAGSRIGQRVAGGALRAYLASLGLPPVFVDELETELNREGLTLGVLARGPSGAFETFAEQEVGRRTLGNQKGD